ncbi:MAG: Gfo/Idh/MocA family oxidoreductase [Bacteroidota bacterium]
MERIFNWGIIGMGKIARKFADDLRLLPNARLHAVASASLDRAQAFAQAYKAPHAYGSYEEIVNCPDLDVVYVATPHILHFSNTMMCLAERIPVLCEKPFAMNGHEAHRMVELARRNQTFLMEGLWTRFIPSMEYALALVAQGEIGEVHTVKADFGFKMPLDPNSRIFNKTLGGGSLLDIGIYPALLALSVFGKPLETDVQAAATFTETGVDESCVFSFQYPGKRLALGHSTVAATTPIEAWIYGTEGTIYLHPRWHHSTRVTVSEYIDGGETKRDMDFPYEGWGYAFEAAHVMKCLAAGKTESDRIPLDFTLDLVDTLDMVRGKIGLEY